MLDLVNTLQGTNSNVSRSHGGTLPLVGSPWPMTHWAPQTTDGRSFESGRWWFGSNDISIYGLRATHQPSPWMGDYGQFTVQPATGELVGDFGARASEYNRGSAVFRPDYVSLQLKRYAVRSELTASERCAVMRFTFARGSSGRLYFDPAGKSHIEIDGRTIRGYSTANNGGVPKNWKAYFVAHLDRDVSGFGTVDGTNVQSGEKTIDGDHAGAYLEFATEPDKPVELTMATSYLGYEQAEVNLARETAGGFDATRARTAAAWENHLSRARVSGGTEEQRRTFYSSLYRAGTFPHKLYELDAKEQPVHFSVYDGERHTGPAYGDIGFWDIYRANFSLWSLLYPEQYRDILNGFVNTLPQSGWFPQWPSPGHRNGMIGTHIDAVIADAVTKKLGGFDAEAAYAGIRKDAFEVPPDGSVGRSGLKEYLALGYVPARRQAGYSVSQSLDYAYDDWCVAQVAKALGKTDDYNALLPRTKNYQKLWDAETGFFRPKRRDGKWLEPFDSYAWGSGYVEGGPWQCTWAVQHDVAGLAELMGGPEKLNQKLDQMMGQPPIFHVGEFRHVIHEMSEMAAVPFGQYAHSNQPVHHVLYLFAAVGHPETTQYWTRRVCEELYNSGPDGFCGDEDNGEMSSWFVLSSLGLFQPCLGDPDYTLTSPLFDRSELTLPDGKRLTIAAKGNSPLNRFVVQMSFNGQPLAEETLSYPRLMQGGEMTVEIAAQPPQRTATTQATR